MRKSDFPQSPLYIAALEHGCWPDGNIRKISEIYPCRTSIELMQNWSLVTIIPTARLSNRTYRYAHSRPLEIVLTIIISQIKLTVRRPKSCEKKLPYYLHERLSYGNFFSHDFGLRTVSFIMPRAEAYGSSFVCLFVCQSLCRGRSYGGIL